MLWSRPGVFRSKPEAIREALRLLFATRPQLSVEAAVQLYREGEITLGRAAEIARITRGSSKRSWLIAASHAL